MAPIAWTSDTERSVPMGTLTKSTVLTCTGCGTTAPVPADRDHSELWDAGWRWLGTAGLFSCPPCPPVVVVDDLGRHLLPS